MLADAVMTVLDNCETSCHIAEVASSTLRFWHMMVKQDVGYDLSELLQGEMALHLLQLLTNLFMMWSQIHSMRQSLQTNLPANSCHDDCA